MKLIKEITLEHDAITCNRCCMLENSFNYCNIFERCTNGNFRLPECIEQIGRDQTIKIMTGYLHNHGGNE